MSPPLQSGFAVSFRSALDISGQTPTVRGLRGKVFPATRHQAKDRWEARVNKDWRFYFTIVDESYRILKLIPHPKK
jgi:plasmid maintenance system killer protein